MAGYTNFDRQYRLIAGPAGKTGFEVGATSPSQPEPPGKNTKMPPLLLRSIQSPGYYCH